ncbi:hypothetical protein [Umezawaea sp. Da 62-37]|uniref:YczE/YyaS/YitT family protein n=1 Tax=Umezawaea sp. Da 62-37 TaxID=3075927 RepID=UPI0028F6E0FB|nr:hypothetical protein [Umezawaea sp. Da 62-37]WNV83171.1 hypothetical protein RM788_33975 [Umezawaea sp. Da 62-37]
MLTGTIMMGLGIAMLLLARFGLLPLDVLHVAVAARTGWTIGGAIIAVQALLLMCHVPLRIKPGLGTVVASVIPAVTCDVLIDILPPAEGTAPRLLLLAAGGTCFAIGTATYLGAGLGTLPRDGLMLAVHQRRGFSPATIRITADITCLLLGAVIIGPVPAVRTGVLGVGSVLLALLLGPAIARLRSARPASRPHSGPLTISPKEATS